MSYLDILDSVKSQTPSVLLENALRRISLPSEAIAEAGIVSSILYGDTITLSNHQMMDSRVLLRLMPEIAKLKPTGDIPPLAVRFYCSYPIQEVTRDLLWGVTLQNFKNPQFLLSAWPDVVVERRDQVVQNIQAEMEKDVRDFRNLLLNIPPDDTAATLVNGLQTLYKYLDDWRSTNPYELAALSRIPLWKNLQKLQHHPLGIPSEIMSQMEHYAEEESRRLEKEGVGKTKEDILEARSYLYDFLLRVYQDDLEAIDNARQLVDFYYNARVCDSVSGGHGLLSVTDSVGQMLMKTQVERLQAADFHNPAPLERAVGFYVVDPSDNADTGLRFSDLQKLWNENDQFHENLRKISLQRQALHHGLITSKKFQQEIEMQDRFLANTLSANKTDEQAKKISKPTGFITYICDTFGVIIPGASTVGAIIKAANFLTNRIVRAISAGRIRANLRKAHKNSYEEK